MQDLLNRHPGNNNRYNLRYQNEFYPIKANTERFKNSYIPIICVNSFNMIYLNIYP
jgi:hypothetical protein